MEEEERGGGRDPGGRILKTVTIHKITEIMGHLFHTEGEHRNSERRHLSTNRNSDNASVPIRE